MMIDLANTFSPYPSGRFPTDGAHNGETFRDTILVPALQQSVESGGEPVVIDIDGVRTFGSSFLEEAFAGLIRKRLFTKEQLHTRLKVVCSKPHLLIFRDMIEKYIKTAQPDNISLHA